MVCQEEADENEERKYVVYDAQDECEDSPSELRDLVQKVGLDPETAKRVGGSSEVLRPLSWDSICTRTAYPYQYPSSVVLTPHP